MKFIAFVFSILMFASVSNAGSSADCEEVTTDISLADGTNPSVQDSDKEKKDSEGTR